MKSVKTLAFGLMLAAGVANGAVTSTLTAATDYNLRGISQNSKQPVLQAGLEVAGDGGLYLGGFLSSVDFDGNKSKQQTEYFSLERDVYAGYRIKTSDDVSLDFGGKYYTYNSNSLNHGEVYGALTYNADTKLSVYYSPNFINGADLSVSKPAYGIALDGTKALPANFSLLAHLGYNTGEAWTDNANRMAYLDYSVGAGYKMGKLDWAFQYVNTNLKMGQGRVTTDKMNNANRLVLSVTTKLPW